MKKIFFYFVVGVLFTTTTQAQHRIDENWLMGYESYAGHPWGITQINFAEDSLNLSWHDMDISFNVSATTISSEQTGEILFSTNGFTILDRNADTMQNAFGFSPCPYSTSYADDGVTFSQGTLILPFPEHPNQYYFFHEPIVIPMSGGTYSNKLLYSFVDLTANSGLGKVVSKNNSIISDSLTDGMIAAVKHANGRDYWVITPRYSADGYHIFLLTPNGIEYKSYQAIGTRRISSGGASTALFSPDGTRYIKHDTYLADRLIILDFDRCTGKFGNPIEIEVPFHGVGGAAISPNSRWLYVNTEETMWQMDLWAADIEASKIVIATYDGYASPFGSTFYRAQLAPNGKIYYCCTNGENVMHVINHPDSAGVACGFQQHGVQLLSYNAFTMPYYPNYYLGAMVGSGCDTITTATSKPIEIANIYAYPNPSKDKIFVGMNYLKGKPILLLVNSLGQEVYRKQIEDTTKETEVSLIGFPQGIYYLKVQTEDNIFTEKILKE